MNSNRQKLQKVPAAVEAALLKFKSDLQEVKDCVKEIQSDMNKYLELAKNCYKKELKRPVLCYEAEFGPIKYTEEQRDEWEEFMKERATKNNTTFKPADYPKTNMIVETAGEGKKKK